jgi:hypothetical protein
MLPNLKLVDWRQTINFLINNDQIKKNTHPVAETYSNYQFNTESNGNLEISSKQQYTTIVMSYYDYNDFKISFSSVEFVSMVWLVSIPTAENGAGLVYVSCMY